MIRFIRSLSRLTKPLVAAVPGRAVGVGTTMFLHCDLVVLADNALLSAPFIGLALVPEAASCLLMPLPRACSRLEAVRVGEPISANVALAFGLVNRLVPQDQLDAEAMALAQRLAKQPPGSLVATKRLMRNAETLMKQMEAESEYFESRLKSAEAREAFQAFAERRPPDFAKLA